ncbi:MAG: 50S ribosomal protein L18 [Phycisphaerales bacterium]|nr:50S ribosomal protein L18 [Phycisphaerales bacterium]
MGRLQSRTERRTRRKRGIRKSLMGGPAKPRLTVFRSAKHIYAQLVDDLAGHTIASASSNEKGEACEGGGNISGATEIGKRIAERASSAGVKQIVFDRNGYRYHGRVRALANGAREGGLKF